MTEDITRPMGLLTDAELAALRPETLTQRVLRAMITDLQPNNPPDPRHVEAFMRVEHPTLDAISAVQFLREARVAMRCVAEAGVEQSESLARSFGL